MTRNVLPILITASLILSGLGLAQAPAANPKILLKTTQGDITIELYPA